MVEGKFQRSLHSLDSHKSSARFCRVRAKVSNLRPSRRLACHTFSILIASFLSCVCQIRAAGELPGYAAPAPQEEHEETERGAVRTLQTPGQQRRYY